VGLVNCYMSMTDNSESEEWIKYRLLPFLGLGFFACIPIAHAAFMFPYDQLLQQSGLNYYYLEGVLMVTGVLFLAVRTLGGTPHFIALLTRRF
jgi:adiponectin receptor